MAASILFIDLSACPQVTTAHSDETAQKASVYDSFKGCTKRDFQTVTMRSQEAYDRVTEVTRTSRRRHKRSLERHEPHESCDRLCLGDMVRGYARLIFRYPNKMDVAIWPPSNNVWS